MPRRDTSLHDLSVNADTVSERDSTESNAQWALSAAQMAELDRRLACLRNGEVRTLTWAVVKARLRARRQRA